MNGEAELQGRRPRRSRSASASGYSYRASYTLERIARPGAGAPQRRVGPAAEHARPRVVGRAERLRHPPSLRRQLHRRAAVRRRQADAAGRRRRQDPRRLAGERHLQRALRPAVHGDAGQQQRRRRHDRPAEPDRRSARAPKTVEQWFNPAAFTQVPSGTFGNAGRNILRGPGWVTFDMSVQRAHRRYQPRQRDAALGHLQHVQPRELRPAGAQHRRRPTPA